MAYAKWAAKALYAGTAAGIASAILAAPDGYTPVECLVIAGAVVAAVGGVFGLPNGPDPRG